MLKLTKKKALIGIIVITIFLCISTVIFVVGYSVDKPTEDIIGENVPEEEKKETEISEEEPEEDNVLLTYEEIVGTFSNVEMRTFDGTDSFPFGEEIILKIDRTFTFSFYGYSRGIYSGTYNFINNELNFNATHFNNCEIEKLLAETGECDPMTGGGDGLIGFPDFHIVIADKNTLNYIYDMPDSSGNINLGNITLRRKDI